MPRKEKIINWEKILRQWFTLSRVEKDKYREIASGYSRCAVGEQRMRHPKVVIYSKPFEDASEPLPTDQPLYNLGFRFYEDLNNAFYADGDRVMEAEAIVSAMNTLHEIKERVKELTKEAHS